LEGYRSKYTKGWPKDTVTRYPKIQLFVNDGDYTSAYLGVEEIPTASLDGSTASLKEAILNGEFDGSITMDEFSTRILERSQKQNATWELEFKYKQFLKDDPLKEVNDAVDEHNKTMDGYKTFRLMVTELKKAIKENPGWFKRIKKVNKNHGLTDEELFIQLRRLEDIKEKQSNVIGLLDSVIEDAVMKYNRGY